LTVKIFNQIQQLEIIEPFNIRFFIQLGE